MVGLDNARTFVLLENEDLCADSRCTPRALVSLYRNKLRRLKGARVRLTEASFLRSFEKRLKQSQKTTVNVGIFVKFRCSTNSNEKGEGKNGKCKF